MTISLGVCTVNRPEFAEKCLKSIVRHLNNEMDHLYLYNDGSDPRHTGAYKRVYRVVENAGGTVIDSPTNGGVAVAKNALLEAMMADGADWMFLCEDDLRILSPEAVTSYVSICEKYGHQHFSFAHHGPANVDGPVETDGDIAYYPHSIGAWTNFSREIVESVGLFDTHMVNAFEHVEWEIRAYAMGYAPGGGPHRFADALGSEAWIGELPNSIEKSSIRPRDDWYLNIHNALTYWHDEKPDTYVMMFGPGMPLHDYANGILQGVR